MNVTGKTVLITGASRGIGEATAHAFAQAGARVCLIARSADRLAALAANIPGALALPCDVSSWDQVSGAVQKAEDQLGPIDVLINNAGAIEPIDLMHAADPEGWGHVIDINLKGVFYGMRAVMSGMLARGGGTILNISSGAATHPLEGWSHYCASKAAALMLTRSAHLEVGDRLRIIGLSPGTVATQMQVEIKDSGVNPVAQLDWEDHIPPDWPARTLLWMCGADADPWRGQDISLRDPQIRAAVGLE